MSADDDTELRDLLVQTLEKNGTLAKIRAQLRASVFLALEEREAPKKKAPLQNEKAKQFGETEHGRLCAELVADFMEILNLDAALSVFSAEFQLTNRRARSNLAASLNLDVSATDTKPLLYSLLESNRQQNGVIVKKSIPESVRQTTPQDKPVNGAMLNKDGKSIEDNSDDDFFAAKSTKKPDLDSQRPNLSNVTTREKSVVDGKEKQDDVFTTKKADQKSGSSSLSFLGDLPALSSQNRSVLPPMAKEKGPKDMDFMKLLGDSLENSDPDSTPKSSARMVPGLDLKKLDPKSDTKNQKLSPVETKAKTDDENGKKQAEQRQRKDSSPDEEISEEIAEDLEVDDLLDSTRSSRQLSF